MATILVTLWILSGITGLRFGGVPPADGADGALDHLLAGALGPCTFLLAGLATQASDEPERDEQVTRDGR